MTATSIVMRLQLINSSAAAAPDHIVFLMSGVNVNEQSTRVEAPNKDAPHHILF